MIYTFLEGIDDAALLRFPAPMDEGPRDTQHAKPYFMDRAARFGGRSQPVLSTKPLLLETTPATKSPASDPARSENPLLHFSTPADSDANNRMY